MGPFKQETSLLWFYEYFQSSFKGDLHLSASPQKEKTRKSERKRTQTEPGRRVFQQVPSFPTQYNINN